VGNLLCYMKSLYDLRSYFEFKSISDQRSWFDYTLK
jgi:hypothetical protein